MQNSKYDYFFFRLPVALSMLGHGLVRLPKLEVFSQWMVTYMEKSFLPAALVTPFSYFVPFVELLVGLLLLIGFLTRPALYLGIALMAVMVFGNTTVEKWDAITPELIHAGYMAGLLFTIRYNTFSLDAFLKRNKTLSIHK
jgi:thiosulfate dehydrogenase [quinone] large subunit